MQRWEGRVALVTGASAGIGAGIAQALVRQGMRVAGCGRRLDRLQEIEAGLKGAKGSFLPIQCDVRDETQILAMFEKISATWGGVDVCINNAGLQKVAPLATGTTEDWRNMLEVNVLALCICSREALKSMKGRGVDDGHIIHINSLSGHRIYAAKDIHFYAMTKHAVKAHTEGLRNELREINSGIRVSAISPGFVKSEMMEATFGVTKEESDKFHADMAALETSDIADTVVFILGSPPHMQVHDILLRPVKQTS